MGCYLETDFVTRLPIFRGDEVLVLFGYNVNTTLDKYYDECLHPFHGRFDPKMDCTHRIRCFFGTYNEYGWIEEDNADAYELMEKGYPLMVRKETYLYFASSCDCCYSIAESCQTLCHPVDCSTPNQ